MTTSDAVLVISFGGPEKKDDIMPFLEIVTKGRGIPRERLLEVAHHYEEIGGKSPINDITRDQADLLKNALAKARRPMDVYIGQRNWHPFVEDTLRAMAKAGVTRAVGFITAAHRSEASLERYIQNVEAARARLGPTAPVIDYVNPWFDHPRLIEALCSRVEEVLQSAPSDVRTAPWYFTAHSIPCMMAKNSTYVLELERTAHQVAQRLGKADWGLAYSSRSGNPREPWLEPDVCDVVKDAGAKGKKHVLFIPIGFVADHVEILFDLDIEAKQAAAQAGVTLWRAKSVGTHPIFGKMMAEVVLSRLNEDARQEQTISTVTRFQDGTLAECAGKTSTRCFCDPHNAQPPCCAWAANLAQAVTAPQR